MFEDVGKLVRYNNLFRAVNSLLSDVGHLLLCYVIVIFINFASVIEFDLFLNLFMCSLIKKLPD